MADSVQYQYTASGRHCDTTSELKTIDASVKKAITFMHNKNVNDACFKLTHGGTWKGLLQLAGGDARIVNYKCLSVPYTFAID